MKTKICLALTEQTLEKNLQVFNKYKHEVDLLELRMDYLSRDEFSNVYSFPSLVDVPVILTIRRKIDGGEFTEDEKVRASLFSLALTFSENDAKRFEFVDFESDFFVPNLEYTCKMYGIKIIRSIHLIREALKDIDCVLEELKKHTYDIIKIASNSYSLKDTLNLFQMAKKIKNEDFVLIAMGEYGLTSRILSNLIGSCFVYTFNEDYINRKSLSKELLDPHTLHSIYHFNKINYDTNIFGVIGGAVNNSLSPSLHNAKFENNNSVYIPISAKNVDEACNFVKYLRMKGISITNPFKESIISYVDELEDEANTIKSINTISYFNNRIKGYNTDIYGFEKALREFLDNDLIPSSKVSVLGAGGVSRAVCYVLKKMMFKDVVIFNRTLEKAKNVAFLYNFNFALLDVSSLKLLNEHSDLIINTTSLGDENILPFYEFNGHEYVFDLIYNPEKTKLLQNAQAKGCKICNGYSMLKYQAEKQSKIFMGDEL
ncbi:MAG: type I 3-dehydroquinate dehydratase [Treponema sp.]